MAYDAGRDEVVMFGGRIPLEETRFDDTWILTGDTWQQRHPAASPPALAGVSMTYDPVRDEVVLFGGERDDAHSTLSDETWVWDGATWVERHPATTPPARSRAAMAFDPELGAVVMFGGDIGYNRLDDTWVWNGTDWRELTDASGPLPMSDSGMTSFDGGVVLFGGYGGVEDRQLLNRTWQLRDEQWHLLGVDQPRIAWYGMGIATDTSRDRIIAFGGTRVPEFGLFSNGRTLKLSAPASTVAGARSPTDR
jgi:hypothetical protein